MRSLCNTCCAFSTWHNSTLFFSQVNECLLIGKITRTAISWIMFYSSRHYSPNENNPQPVNLLKKPVSSTRMYHTNARTNSSVNTYSWAVVVLIYKFDSKAWPHLMHRNHKQSCTHSGSTAASLRFTGSTRTHHTYFVHPYNNFFDTSCVRSE